MNSALPESYLAEMDAAFPRECGIEAFDQEELDRLVGAIRHVVWEQLNVTVTEVYVMGSFARGEARRVASDLDLRIEVNGIVSEVERCRVEKKLKSEYGPDVVPEAAGYLDPHITPLRPVQEPNVPLSEYIEDSQQ